MKPINLELDGLIVDSPNTFAEFESMTEQRGRIIAFRNSDSVIIGSDGEMAALNGTRPRFFE